MRQRNRACFGRVRQPHLAHRRARRLAARAGRTRRRREGCIRHQALYTQVAALWRYYAAACCAARPHQRSSLLRAALRRRDGVHRVRLGRRRLARPGVAASTLRQLLLVLRRPSAARGARHGRCFHTHRWCAGDRVGQLVIRLARWRVLSPFWCGRSKRVRNRADARGAVLRFCRRPPARV
jgi:hypothetical protein